MGFSKSKYQFPGSLIHNLYVGFSIEFHMNVEFQPSKGPVHYDPFEGLDATKTWAFKGHACIQDFSCFGNDGCFEVYGEDTPYRDS